MSVPTKEGRKEESFKMSDYWLIVLYLEKERSWEYLKEMARGAQNPDARIKQIEDLRGLLKNIGYLENPEELLIAYGPPTNEDLEDAINWFFNK